MRNKSIYSISAPPETPSNNLAVHAVTAHHKYMLVNPDLMCLQVKVSLARSQKCPVPLHCQTPHEEVW